MAKLREDLHVGGKFQAFSHRHAERFPFRQATRFTACLFVNVGLTEGPDWAESVLRHDEHTIVEKDDSLRLILNVGDGKKVGKSWSPVVVY